MSKPPTPVHDLFQEETDDPLVADRRNFFKVELWTRDGQASMAPDLSAEAISPPGSVITMARAKHRRG